MRDLVRSFSAPVALLVLPVAIARAQAPAAPETIVNSYTTAAQGVPSVSADRRGGYLVVWDSDTQDGSNLGVFGRRFDVAGAPVGAEFQVNTNTVGTQSAPDVAVDGTGDFVVTWTDFALGPEIKARRFDRSGSAMGSEFLVNGYTTGVQGAPAIAVGAAGNFVIVWQSNLQDGNNYGVFGRRLDAGGASLGSEFQVNTYVTGSQARPDVAFTADGGFVVAFDGPDSFAQGIHARRYDVNGAALGAEIPVATALASQVSAAIAALPGGGFVVSWTSYGQDGSHNGVFARMFDAAGAPTTSELPVNSHTTNGQQFSAVAADGTGGFVVTWDSLDQDGSERGVFGQRFDPAGVRVGGEFAVNSYTTGFQAAPSVTADSAGNFAVVWVSATQDGSVSAAVSRRFQGLAPSALGVDTLGNGVLEPGETARLVPAWRNTTTAAQGFTGTLGAFTGPAGGTYTVTDPVAAYTQVAAGDLRSCADSGDCYEISVGAATRPAAHWDTAATEALAGPPAVLALRKRWTLHVGDSFTDVPRSNPFYRFVEALLHHGVTGGCGGGSYCASSSTSREQMAVFVVLAREGPGYVPAACATPVFGDVPASSPFCRWIEELARRGVAGGCGGGNYCPSVPVTRDQMTVFVLRSLDFNLSPPPCAPPNLYLDVSETNPFCPWIEELTRRGVVSGCGGGNYCPGGIVTREQMGVFLGVTFGLTLYGP